MKLHDIVTNTIPFIGVPIGSTGTIIHCYNYYRPKDIRVDAFEVEFTLNGENNPVFITALGNQLVLKYEDKQSQITEK